MNKHCPIPALPINILSSSENPPTDEYKSTSDCKSAGFKPNINEYWQPFIIAVVYFLILAAPTKSFKFFLLKTKRAYISHNTAKQSL